MGSHSKSAAPKRPKTARTRHAVRPRSQDSDIIYQHPDGDMLRRAIRQSDSSSPADLLTLQRLAGNTAVQLLTQPDAVLDQPTLVAEPEDGQLAQRLAVKETAVTSDSGGLIQRGWFSRAAKWVKGKASKAYRGAKSLASKAVGGAVGLGKRAYRGAKSLAGRVIKGAVGLGSKVYRGAKNLVSAVARGVGKAATSIWGLAKRAYGGVRGLIGAVAKGASTAYKSLVKWARRAAGIVGPPGAVRPTADGKILASHQAARVKTKYSALSSRDKDRFDALLLRAGSDSKQRYLYKALAAGHTVAEIGTFAGKIRGKNAAWMQNNLRLTSSTTGTGVQQQWSHSCNITTVQAVQGEMDPIYALRIHEQNPNFGVVDEADATKRNPKLAAEQKAGLESVYGGTKFGAHSGVAAARGAAGGAGRWADDLLNSMSEVTGLTYSTKLVGPDTTPAQARASIDTALSKGMPVPIVIGNGAGQYTHYVLVTGKVDKPTKKYTIHDPWSGKTVTRTEAQMKNGTLNIANSNQITAIEDPSTKKD